MRLNGLLLSYVTYRVLFCFGMYTESVKKMSCQLVTAFG